VGSGEKLREALHRDEGKKDLWANVKKGEKKKVHDQGKDGKEGCSGLRMEILAELIWKRSYYA